MITNRVWPNSTSACRTALTAQQWAQQGQPREGYYVCHLPRCADPPSILRHAKTPVIHRPFAYLLSARRSSHPHIESIPGGVIGIGRRRSRPLATGADRGTAGAYALPRPNLHAPSTPDTSGIPSEERCSNVQVRRLLPDEHLAGPGSAMSSFRALRRVFSPNHAALD